MIGRYFFALLLLAIPVTAAAADLEQSLFNRYQSGVVQVRVIDRASGEKSSIGSGFAVQADGLIVSNYHVVADYIDYPDKHRLEYIDSNGGSGALQLLDIDVINDLSILKVAEPAGPEGRRAAGLTRFAITDQKLSKGEDIFSMGNPLDLGMSIIQGIYNGEPEHSLYHRILFSGSLNPGMSGGPALDRQGNVVGVNVSTSGNEISFLVPAAYVQALIERVRGRTGDTSVDFKKRIGEQLFEHQQNYIGPLLEQTWQNKPLESALVTPERIADFIKCWGHSDKDEEGLYDETSRFCSNQDSIYLGRDFQTGSISYDFKLLKDKSLGVIRFYNLYQQRYSNMHASFGYADKEDLTDPLCHSEVVDMDGHLWKVGFCSRRYQEYDSLYDIALSMALLKQEDTGVIANLTIEGCGKEEGMKLARKFMESIRWQP